MPFLKDFRESVWSFLSPRKPSVRHSLVEPPSQQQTSEARHSRKRQRAWSDGAHDGITTSENGGTDGNGSNSLESEARKRRKLSLSSAAGESPGVESERSGIEQEQPTQFDGDNSLISGFDESFTPEIDDSLVVGEEEYERDANGRKKVIDLPEEIAARGVSVDELRQAGWDREHIQLVQKLAMRGYEPLLPAHYKWDYRFLPDGLFSQTNEAFISSVRGQHYRSIKALEKLFETGGRARDRLRLNNSIQPEDQVRSSLENYMKWATEDAGLDSKSSIPTIAIVAEPSSTASSVLQNMAKTKLKILASRYHDAFDVQPSIESSPVSDRTHLSHPIPQLYAVIASSTVVALVAYRPDTEQEIRPVVFFDYQDKSYDVWNSLALAIIVNHCRNTQAQIAKNTGVGEMKTSEDNTRAAKEDPDL